MIIFRYIAKELYLYLIAITFILLVIFITNQFMLSLKDVARGHVTMTVVMQLMALQVPLLLGFLLPLGLFLSILMVFGRLYLDSEMTILSACGLSPIRLLTMLVYIATFIMLLVAWLMFWFEPIVQQYRVQVMEKAVALATLSKVIPQQFLHVGGKGIIYADQVSHQDEKMDHVFLAKKGDPNSDGSSSWDITVSKLAHNQLDAKTGKSFLVFEQGYRYIGTPGQKQFQAIQYDSYGVRPLLKSNQLNIWPKGAPTLLLWHMRAKDPLAAGELQWRIAMPLSVILLTLLAFPLSRVNPRQGKFTHLIPAILIYIFYANLLFLGRAWIERGYISRELGLWWIHGSLLLIIIGIYIYRKRS